MTDHTPNDDAETWSTPCEKCGSHRVSSTEINEDCPEADEHETFYCTDCGESR